MSYWLVECRDSDGNDCMVMDFIVEAQNPEVALNKVMDKCMSRCPSAEEDGGYGAWYACCCEIPDDELDTWECNHGGFWLDEQLEGPFETRNEAREASPVYHRTEDI